MSAQEAQAEPTMEEILASIRRIISEDENTSDQGEASPDEILDLNEMHAAPVEEPVAETVDNDFDFDALDASEPEMEAQEPEPESDDIIVMDREEDMVEDIMPPDSFEEMAEPEPEPMPEPVMEMPREAAPVFVPPQLEKTIGLIGESTAEAAAAAFARLGTNLPGHFATGASVEELVAYMLKPMLKQWLDTHLPRIVEERVEAELARIARRGF